MASIDAQALAGLFSPDHGGLSAAAFATQLQAIGHVSTSDLVETLGPSLSDESVAVGGLAIHGVRSLLAQNPAALAAFSQRFPRVQDLFDAAGPSWTNVTPETLDQALTRITTAETPPPPAQPTGLALGFWSNACSRYLNYMEGSGAIGTGVCLIAGTVPRFKSIASIPVCTALGLGIFRIGVGIQKFCDDAAQKQSGDDDLESSGPVAPADSGASGTASGARALPGLTSSQTNDLVNAAAM